MNDPRRLRVTLAPARVAILLAAVAGGLVALHLVGLVFTFALGQPRRAGWSGAWYRTFNLDLEGNAPTFYAASTLLLCAALLALLARTGASRGERWRWAGLAATFAFLAVDEAAELHERLSRPVRAALDVSGALHFAWVVPYGVALLALSVAYAPFLLRLPRRPRAHLLLAAALYGAALPLELLGGAEMAARGNRSLRYALVSTAEEALELAGVIVCAYALLLLLGARRVTVELEDGGRAFD